MHGQIGEKRDGSQRRDNLDFYYRTRATLIEARRLGGGGGIDYDFYRARARAERARVHREMFRSLRPYLRPLAAVALLAAAIFMVPKHTSDSAASDAPARPFKSMTSNPYSNLYPNNPSE